MMSEPNAALNHLGHPVPQFDSMDERNSWAWDIIKAEYPRACATPFPAENGYWIVTGTGSTISWGKTADEAAFESARLLLHTQRQTREWDEMQHRKRK